MALPQSTQAWPPAQVGRTLPMMGVWSAWYAGDSDQLSSVYGGASGADPTATGFFASDHGGFRATVGRALTRWFWGEASRGPDRRVKLHVPIAAELCQASADLLFADQITLKVEDETTQARLDVLCDDGLHTELAEAAEVAAALGGVYLRVTWDDTVSPDAPFLTHVDADQAIPEFTWGRLTAVTFWQVVARDGKRVYRHLERHETTETGTGIILHGLYEGEEDKLGHPIPLTDLPATAGLAAHVNAFGAIDSGSEGLCVVYVPNQSPNRRWRTDQHGRHLGRSDLDGVEQLMDALDEVYTSWMRDVRLGKSRLMIAKSLLDNVGTGSGSAFNAEQEAYASMNMLAGADAKLADQIEQVQFKIRVQEHKATAAQLVQDILQMAGYSSETFGIYDGGGGIKTATEVEAKQQRSLLTRDRKIRLWRPAIAQVIEKLLAVDQALFGTPLTVQAPDVLFPDGVQESPLSIAQTVQALRAADAASDKVIVGMVHPDWDEDDVEEEVGLIVAARQLALPAALPDPMYAHEDGMTDGTAPTGDGKPALDG
jgi:A118 family predicted phage portal protein